MSICIIGGCERTARLRDTCSTHTICIYSGCTNGYVRSSGYCPTHELRIRRYGTPDVARALYLPFFHMVTANKVRKVASRLDLDAPNGCWETMTKDPRARVNLGWDGVRQVYVRSYVLMWAWTHQRDPVTCIDHLCSNARCARPEHLEEVPHQINMLRAFERKRGA